MAEATTDAHLFQTCFVSAPSGRALGIIVKLLNDRGIAAQGVDILPPGSPIFDEITRAIAASDFVVVVLTDRSSENTIFELGLARGMNKPTLIFTIDRAPPSDLQGFVYRALKSLDHIEEVAPDLDRFLRNAKTLPPIIKEAPRAQGTDLGWARDELKAQRGADYGHRYRDFEALVGRVFAKAGAQVEAAGYPSDDRGVDFVVWLNDVAYALGGPILVECKVLPGGSGSVIKNAEAYVAQLNKALARSDASLGLLVFDHDRPNTPPTTFASPNVIAFSVDDLIDGLEAGTFEQQVVRRRRRATVLGGGA